MFDDCAGCGDLQRILFLLLLSSVYVCVPVVPAYLSIMQCLLFSLFLFFFFFFLFNEGILLGCVTGVWVGEGDARPEDLQNL